METQLHRLPEVDKSRRTYRLPFLPFTFPVQYGTINTIDYKN